MASGVPIARMRLTRRRFLSAWAHWLAVACLCLAAADTWPQARPSEYDVEAAYLLNFGKFMRWSGGQQAHSRAFEICILGRDPMGSSMDQIAANETINGLPVRVRRIPDATQTQNCQVIYFSPSEAGRLREDLAILDGKDILTVGDVPDFLDLGGMIEFVVERDHVRFMVNLNAVDRTHIVLSSELLRVAASVQGNPNRGGTR